MPAEHLTGARWLGRLGEAGQRSSAELENALSEFPI